MSNVIAGVVRGQYPHLEEHIARKREIYERYKAALADLPVKMNPYDEEKMVPNFWLSCMIIEPEAMCKQVRSDTEAMFIPEPGKSCPTEILEALAQYNAEGRPIWKPMHMQPIYRTNPFVTREGDLRESESGHIRDGASDVGRDIFERGLCLPSDIKMTNEEQDRVIAIIRNCFE
jgi:dTDP-4-amino-4,6-dideoxygalactose transaminase